MSMQKAKDILETMVASKFKKGASYVPSLSGSDRVIYKKVETAYRLIRDELGQGQWREVNNGWTPSALSENLAVWDGESIHHGVYYHQSIGRFFYTHDFDHGEIENVTHYMEVNPAPPNKVRV